MTTLYRADGMLAPGGPDALLVEDGRIAWLGAAAAAPAPARTVDLRGTLVLPAFVDAHVHATGTGLALDGLDLAGARSLTEALDRVTAYATATAGRVVLGTGWDETTWPERRAPTLAELDRAAPGRPVYLARADVHSAVVSPALVRDTPGARTESGWSESGHVRLQAHHLLRAAAYAAVTPDQRAAAQRRTRSRAAELGIGSLHEMSGPEVAGEADLTALLALAAAEPGPGVVGYWAELGETDLPVRLGVGAAGDLFCDGAIGSHTAALTEPYADRPETSGHLYHDAAAVAAHVSACTRRGLQAGFHAIGDRALTAVADGFAAAAAELGEAAVRAARHRVEHAEMPTAAVIDVFARLGITASVQSAFDATWGGPDGMYVERLGPGRGVSLNPLAAFAAAGVPIALGSDSPVTPLDPWGGIRAAVRHRTAGAGLDHRTAFAAATTGGWRAARIDGAGTLAVGAPATFAAWRADALTPDGLPDLDAPDPDCRLTVVDGVPAYSAD